MKSSWESWLLTVVSAAAVREKTPDKTLPLLHDRYREPSIWIIKVWTIRYKSDTADTMVVWPQISSTERLLLSNSLRNPAYGIFLKVKKEFSYLDIVCWLVKRVLTAHSRNPSVSCLLLVNDGFLGRAEEPRRLTHGRIILCQQQLNQERAEDYPSIECWL